MNPEGPRVTMPGRDWFEGYRLLILLTLLLIALCLWLAGMRHFDAEGVRMAVRFTARSSLVLFCLAFSAAAVARLRPNGWTRWQLRNRRQFGLAFAASHGLHALALVAFARLAPAAFASATSFASYLFGGIGYAVIVAMAVTSFDRTAAALGPRRFRLLHLIGGYYLLVQFSVSLGMRIPGMPNYALFLIPLAATVVMRFAASLAARAATRADRPDATVAH
jgi:DMSO/TMAO reductase YedYZ heme-binding membrane subunit